MPRSMKKKGRLARPFPLSLLVSELGCFCRFLGQPLFLFLRARGPQRDIEVARTPADAFLADTEGLELPAEGRHRKGLLVPFLAPAAVAFVKILRGEARAARGHDALAVVALDIAVGQQRLATDLVVVGAQSAHRRPLLVPRLLAVLRLGNGVDRSDHLGLVLALRLEQRRGSPRLRLVVQAPMREGDIHAETRADLN